MTPMDVFQVNLGTSLDVFVATKTAILIEPDLKQTAATGYISKPKKHTYPCMLLTEMYIASIYSGDCVATVECGAHTTFVHRERHNQQKQIASS